MVKKTFQVEGMHCNSCSTLIENELRDFVKSVKASYKAGTAEVEYDDEKISEKKIIKLIEKAGYEVEDNRSSKDDSTEPKSLSDKIGFYVMIGSLIVLAVVVYQYLLAAGLEVPTFGENTSYILLFFVGILTGFHCISMCGAFVVSYTSGNAKRGHKGMHQHFVYGGSKLLSYTIIGGLFGLIGGIFAFSIALRAGVSIFAGVFMIFFALSMMGFKWFRKFQLNPKFLMKASAKASKKAKGPYKAPMVIGLLSGLFIACGPLQAMYIFAAGTGSMMRGALSLFSFGIGTLPVMLGFGGLTTMISHKTTRKILKFSAWIVLLLGLIMLNRGLTVVGSPLSYDSIKAQVIGVDAAGVSFEEGVQIISMKVDRSGWSPDSFVLKKGVPARWEIDVEELTGCNNEIIVQEYGLDVKLKKGLNVVEFTPDKAKTVRWSCWMGMIPGSFIVTDDGQASEQEVQNSAPVASGSCTSGADGGSCGTPTCGSTTGSGGCGCGG